MIEEMHESDAYNEVEEIYKHEPEVFLSRRYIAINQGLDRVNQS